MNEITATKAEFKLDLDTAGLNVVEYVPGRVTPPIVIITSGGTYITSGTLGGEYLLSLDCVCVAARADNESATEELDQLIADLLLALQSLEYAALTGVGQPYTLTTNNTEYLAANVSLNILMTL
jgi:hypothetical protein